MAQTVHSPDQRRSFQVTTESAPGGGGRRRIAARTGRAASRLTPALWAAVLGTTTARTMTMWVRIRTRECATSPAKAGGTKSACAAKPTRTSATAAASITPRRPVESEGPRLQNCHTARLTTSVAAWSRGGLGSP